MKSQNKDIGNYGENLASDFLKKQGCTILFKNWRASNLGEIDIIAKDKDTLIFVEVKTRSNLEFGHPLEAITTKKAIQIRKLAAIFISEQKYSDIKNYRFDAISIILQPKIQISHIKNIEI